MCKIMCIAGIKPEHLTKVHKLAKAAAKNMSIVEDDGVGYAAITKSGTIYGEKWRNKDDAFNIHTQPKNDPMVDLMSRMFGDMADWVNAPVTSKVYDSFGNRDAKSVNETVAIILHARKATTGSSKVIENVHPFVQLDVQDEPDTALIHNGSILNHAKLTKTMSTCDSEVILHEYLANNMYHNPWGIEQVAKTLIGEYAVGVLSSMRDTDGTYTPILDIFKSGKELMVGYVPELETFVFCTSEHTLENSCKEAELTLKNPIKLKEGFLMRLNAITGNKIDDLISFKTSSKWENGYTDSHTNSRVRPYNQQNSGVKDVVELNKNVNPITGEYTEDDGITATSDDTIDSAKKHFERRHPSLFTMPYIEVNGPLEANERELFSELSKGKDTNHKALHLVAVAIASVAKAK